MRNLILLNGPPRCGKDTAAALMRTFIVPMSEYKLSRPLKAAITEFFGINPVAGYKRVFEDRKDEPVPELLNKTAREVQISLSEDWAKPLYGVDIFGRLAVRHLNNSPPGTYVISDCGFREEAIPMVKLVRPENVLLIQITRDECSFDGDSRSYIDLTDMGVTTVELYNRFDLFLYTEQLKKAVRGWKPDLLAD